MLLLGAGDGCCCGYVLLLGVVLLGGACSGEGYELIWLYRESIEFITFGGLLKGSCNNWCGCAGCGGCGCFGCRYCCD